MSSRALEVYKCLRKHGKLSKCIIVIMSRKRLAWKLRSFIQLSGCRINRRASLLIAVRRRSCATRMDDQVVFGRERTRLLTHSKRVKANCTILITVFWLKSSTGYILKIVACFLIFSEVDICLVFSPCYLILISHACLSSFDDGLRPVTHLQFAKNIGYMIADCFR